MYTGILHGIAAPYNILKVNEKNKNNIYNLDNMEPEYTGTGKIKINKYNNLKKIKMKK